MSTSGGVLVEAAVESVEEALAAERAGARRLELCAELDVGGTTPSAALLADVKRAVSIPVAVMIRPRGGDFVYSRAEIDSMLRDVAMARSGGADAVVFGPLDRSGRIDEAQLRELVGAAAGTPAVFHRAFDRTPDLDVALDALIAAGVARVLTSGGAATALDGARTLARLVDRAKGRIEILAGGKVRAENVRAVVETSGVTQVHARGTADGRQIAELAVILRSAATKDLL